MAHNKLMYLPTQLFANMTFLQELYLHTNDLEHLDPEAFKDPCNIKHLERGNKLTHLQPDTFQNLTLLQNL
jgi:hypothetical protein